MEARKLTIGHGWMWIKQGLWLFKQSPFIWMVLTSILVVGTFGIATFPYVGGALVNILFPGFFAGLMLGCHALAKEEKLELGHIFSGFQKHGALLVKLGGISLAIKLLLVGGMILAGGEKLMQMMMSGERAEDPQALMQAFTEAGMAFPVFIVLSMVLETCVLLAAMLAVFREVTPIPALLAALRATFHNVLPLLAYSVLLIPFAILASIPLMLGWLVLMPIVITSQYAIYRDMFPMPEDLRAAAGNTAKPGGLPPSA